MSQEIIHVAIVEDNDDLRQMLAYVINGSPGFYCKHTFVDCESAIKELPNTYVHVVLMDIELPGINGIEGVKILKEKLPKVDFIMLTVKQDDQSLFGSLCAGATGYLTKDTPPVQLLQSVKEVHEGGAPMSTRIARKVVGSFNIGNKKSPLSPRESEILKLLCNGLNYRSIADELFLSAHTIKTHIKNIYKKLHVNTRAGAVKKAIDDGLI